jgi:hypothetical protein
MELTFSINRYDSDGDLVEECVTLNVGDNVSLHFKNVKELEEFAKNIKKMIPEIKETIGS